MKKIDLLDDNTLFIQEAISGNIFIYPTDTIYGIGAIVNPETIQRLDTAKQRLAGKHYSIIAPNIAWIQTYFDVQKTFKTERKYRQQKFPNRGLTLLLPLIKQASTIDFSLLSSTQTIGVRLLDHPFQQYIEALGQPFITTSCNISGTQTINQIEVIPEALKNHVDYVIDGGVLDGQASVVIDYTTQQVLRS